MALVVIAMVAVALRVAWVLSVQPAPTHDAKWYFGRAKVVANFHALTVGGRPTAYRPPLYPVILGGAFSVADPSLATMRWLNVVFSGLSVICLFVVARQLSRSVSVACWTTVLFALYPTDIAYTSLALSESQFNLFMLGAVASAGAGRKWSFGIAAICCCAAMLTRAQGVLLVPVVGLLLAGQPLQKRRRRVLTVVAFCMLVACFATPYWIRNARAFGAFVPIANNGGVNLYIGNNPLATGGYRFDKAVFAQLPASLNRKSLGSGGPPERQVDQEFSRLARSYILAHPRDTLRLWPAKLGELYRSDLIAFDWNLDPTLTHGWIFHAARRVAQDYYLMLWALAAFAFQAFCVRSRGVIAQVGSGTLVALCLVSLGVPVAGVAVSAMLALLVLRQAGLRSMQNPQLAAVFLVLLTASHLVYFGGPRFHHPMMPWIALLAGCILAAALRAAMEFWLSYRSRSPKTIM